MKRHLATYLLLLFSLLAFGQDATKDALSKLGKHPIIIIDEQQVSIHTLAQFEPKDIARFTILHDTSATKKYGAIAEDGAVIVETIPFAKYKFIKHFKRISRDFESLYNQHPDSMLVFILKDSLLENDYEGDLSLLCESNKVDRLEIVSKDQLQSRFNKLNWLYGVVIHTKEPEESTPEQQD